MLRFDDFVDDLRLLEQRARAAHPGAPVFVFGHSMGGLVALRFALRYQDELRGLALSAPALRFGERTPAVLRAWGASSPASHPPCPSPAPGRRPRAQSLLSRDPEVQRAFDADPLNYHGPVRARMGYQMLRAAQEARGRFEALRLPLLVLQGDADRYVVPAGAASCTSGPAAQTRPSSGGPAAGTSCSTSRRGPGYRPSCWTGWRRARPPRAASMEAERGAAPCGPGTGSPYRVSRVTG